MPVYIENRLDIFNEQETAASKRILIRLQRHVPKKVRVFRLSHFLHPPGIRLTEVGCDLIKCKQRKERGHVQSSRSF